MNDFNELCDICENLWRRCKRVRLVLKPVDAAVQRTQRNHVVAVLHDWQQFLQASMESLQEETWKQELDDRILTLLRQESILQFQTLPRQTQAAFLKITKQFIRDALAFDEKLRLEDIMQAMRNVWIILLLECMLQRPLSYHKAVFAYSMLYPYTDNFLDDPHISDKEKEQFNDWLSERLKGNKAKASTAHACLVDSLVAMIEDTFDRASYPQVYEALLYIQRGQILSLKQKHKLHEDELLRISIYKGGASVLADGYLMDGNLCREEAVFCVEYGFLLQVADDIQDMDSDRSACQYTLASVLYRKRQRLYLAEKLHAFILEVLFHQYPRPASSMQSFAAQNCCHLLIGSIATQLSLFPGSFARHMKHSLPITLEDMQKMGEDTMRWLKQWDITALLYAYTQDGSCD